MFSIVYDVPITPHLRQFKAMDTDELKARACIMAGEQIAILQSLAARGINTKVSWGYTGDSARVVFSTASAKKS